MINVLLPTHFSSVLVGASGGEAKDGPGGGHDEGAACRHGERTGEHAGQSTRQLPGAPDHADKGDLVYCTSMDNTLITNTVQKKSGI